MGTENILTGMGSSVSSVVGEFAAYRTAVSAVNVLSVVRIFYSITPDQKPRKGYRLVGIWKVGGSCE